MIVVLVSSELYGDTIAIARDVTASYAIVEMPFAPPLGHKVTVGFRNPRDDRDEYSTEWDDQLAIRAEVCSHVSWKREGAMRVIGVRFLAVVDDGMLAPDAAVGRMH